MDEKEKNEEKKDEIEEIVAEKKPEENKEKKTAKRILIIIIILLLLFCCVYLIVTVVQKQAQTPPEETTGVATTAASDTDEELADNPIDFASLQEGNDEIYAWLKIDDTNVDYPIVQSATNDEFYLKHKAEDKSWSASGAVYTELTNSKDFSDPITVIYGHNGYSDTMFTTLHYFEEQDFFDSHEYFYIYLPNRKLTYQVISAFKYDDRHIMNSFNFGSEAILEGFQEMLQNPTSSSKNVRTDLDVEITTDSKIVILSTCITNQKSSRYLVNGVLVKDEKTN
ncbi:MAG: class B sortase [Clostridiales bacterium]|nr:class B sortase [Clostridiales bacterium]